MIYSDFLDQDELKQYARSINQRAKSLGKPGLITASDLRTRIYESGGKCEWCATTIVREPFEVDHIISLSSGGSNTPNNLAVACPPCNRAKSSKHPARFSQETFARTGIMTPLLQFVLDHYQIEAATQKSLFDITEDESDSSSATDHPASDDPPPYRW